MKTDEEYADDDAKYEAELQARTPEEWAAMAEKAVADIEDIYSLEHLWWRRDAKEVDHIGKLLQNLKTNADRDYALRTTAELADSLRAARDNPEQREQERWQRTLTCIAMIGSCEEHEVPTWLEQARDFSPPDRRGRCPDDDAPLLDHATYAFESLLDALLIPGAKRAALGKKMDTALLQWAGENGIRAGAYDANGKFSLFGTIVQFPGEAHPGAEAP